MLRHEEKRVKLQCSGARESNACCKGFADETYVFLCGLRLLAPFVGHLPRLALFLPFGVLSEPRLESFCVSRLSGLLRVVLMSIVVEVWMPTEAKAHCTYVVNITQQRRALRQR